jgi:RimJ/RimL family protein N-acetyltransferase
MTPSERKRAEKRRPVTDKLVVRRARPEDRHAILEMSKGIWGGNDYLPSIWDRWIADREGALLTVTLNGKPVGCSKITLLSPGEVWLEGLRLHPDLHGRGLSNQIHDATFREALRLKARSVRYSTWIGNEASRHIAETHGFWMVAQTSWMWGEARRRRLRSRRATPEDFEGLLGFVKGSECFATTSGLMGVGWKFAELKKRRLRRLVSDGLALIYPGQGPIEAAALLDVGQIDDDMCLGFVDGSDEQIALLARDALSVGARAGRDEVSAMLPEGRISGIVLRSGFDREIPMQGVVYELGARGVCGTGVLDPGVLGGAASVRGECDALEDMLDRIFRSSELDAAGDIADLLVGKAPLRLNRQNVRDYVLRKILPDTTRHLMTAVLDMSNKLEQNGVRLVLRAVVMHFHREYGLSGDAMTFGPRSVSARLGGRRLAHIRCARTSITMTLGPGFGACFPPDLDLDVSSLTLDETSRDAATGRYERAVLTFRDRSQAKAAIEAVDIIMKSALSGA